MGQFSCSSSLSYFVMKNGKKKTFRCSKQVETYCQRCAAIFFQVVPNLNNLLVLKPFVIFLSLQIKHHFMLIQESATFVIQAAHFSLKLEKLVMSCMLHELL